MRKILGLVFLGVAAACGGSSQHSATRGDVQAYAALSTEVSTAAASYGSAAQGTADVDACRTGHAAYDAQVRPRVERMQQMAPSMDDALSGMGSQMGSAADMGCGADAMRTELDHHATAACASADMAANHAEAARHANAMHDWAEHQAKRCTELEDHMSGMGGGTSTAAACERMSDGTYTLGGMHP